MLGSSMIILFYTFYVKGCFTPIVRGDPNKKRGGGYKKGDLVLKRKAFTHKMLFCFLK